MKIIIVVERVMFIYRKYCCNRGGGDRFVEDIPWRGCRAIKQGMVLDNTWVYSKMTQWHIHTGSWSIVNCWREALTRHYIRCS